MLRLYHTFLKEKAMKELIKDHGHIFDFRKPDFRGRRKNRSRYSLLNEDTKEPKNILVQGVKYLISTNEKEEVEVKENQSIVIKDGEITQIVSADQEKDINLNDIDLIYNASKRGGLVVTPGFINAHAHPPMYMLRSAMIVRGEEGSIDVALKNAIKHERQMNNEDLFYSTVAEFTEEQKMGITTTLSHYHTPQATFNAAVKTQHRLIDAISIASGTDPSATPEKAEEYITSFNKESFSEKDPVIPAISLHYVFRADWEILEKAKKLIEKYGITFTMHLGESEMDIQETIKKFGMRPVEVLNKAGLLGKNLILSHAVHLTVEEIKLLAEKKVGIVHLPTSNLIHKSGRLAFNYFHEHGLDKYTALGTDSVMSKNRLDLITEALQARVMHQDSKVVSYADLFKMITSNGANILGLTKLGKILPGYRADLSFWKLRDRGFIPYDQNDPQTLIGNMITFGGRNIRDLMINGRFVISNRVHNHIDETALLKRIQELHTNLRKRTKNQ